MRTVEERENQFSRRDLEQLPKKMGDRITITVFTHMEGNYSKYFLGTNEREVGYIHFMNNNKIQGHYEGGTIIDDDLKKVHIFVQDGIQNMFDRYGIDVEFLHLF